MNLEEKIREVLFELAVQGNLVDHPSASAEFNWKITDPMSKATHALISLIREAKIEENQIRLDKIIEFENHVPQPGELTTRSFGSASGAMEIEGFKNSFIKRIAELKAEAEL